MLPRYNEILVSGESSLTQEGLRLLPQPPILPSAGTEQIITHGDNPHYQQTDPLFCSVEELNYSSDQVNRVAASSQMTGSPLVNAPGQLTNSVRVPTVTLRAPMDAGAVVSTPPQRQSQEFRAAQQYFDSPIINDSANYSQLPYLPLDNLSYGGNVHSDFSPSGAGAESSRTGAGPVAASVWNKSGLSPEGGHSMRFSGPRATQSPASETSPSISSSDHRKMSYSSGNAPIPQPSEEEPSPVREIHGSPMGARRRQFIRTESPPLDKDGRMTCRFSGCIGTTFDRKCEWRSVIYSCLALQT